MLVSTCRICSGVEKLFLASRVLESQLQKTRTTNKWWQCVHLSIFQRKYFDGIFGFMCCFDLGLQNTYLAPSIIGQIKYTSLCKNKVSSIIIQVFEVPNELVRFYLLLFLYFKQKTNNFSLTFPSSTGCLLRCILVFFLILYFFWSKRIEMILKNK